MGNRTEYLLATMKTPQYDTSGFAQSANQVSNALLSLAQQGQARATQNSQDKANEYAAQLLGQITPSNYYENAAKLRMIGSYATPDMQKGIEGYSADVKDRMSYEANLANSLLKKQEHDNALLEKKQADEEKGLEALTQLGSSYNPIYTSKVEGSKLIPDANLFAKGVEMPTTMSGYKVGTELPNGEIIKTPEQAFQANQQSLMDAYGAVQEYTKDLPADEQKAIAKNFWQEVVATEPATKQYAAQLLKAEGINQQNAQMANSNINAQASRDLSATNAEVTAAIRKDNLDYRKEQDLIKAQDKKDVAEAKRREKPTIVTIPVDGKPLRLQVKTGDLEDNNGVIEYNGVRYDTKKRQKINTNVNDFTSGMGIKK